MDAKKPHYIAALEQAVAAFGRCRVVLLGDYVLDAYLYGETARVSREAPVIVVRKQRLEHRLGGAANTAANLASLGVKTQVLGVVGVDEAGGQVRDLLQTHGVDVTSLRQSEHVTTPVKMRVMAGAFGTSKQQVLRIDDEPQAPPSAALESAMAEALLQCAADVVVISDYGMHSLGSVVLQAVRTLAQKGVRICADSRHQLSEFRGVTAITPNVPEAETMVGFPITDQASVLRAGHMLLSRLGTQSCLLTQGRHGMTLFRQAQEPAHVDIVGSDEVTDVTGAGDTVIATFSAALAAGLGMYNGMLLANCAAGVAVTKTGCVQVRPEELIEACINGGVELEPWVS